MNQLPLPKPKRKEKVQRFGVYRKNLKPKKFKKVIEEKEVEVYIGHPLLEPYHHGIANIPQELYDKVKQRSGGICEICGKNKSEEVHHLAGRRRVACLENLLDVCISCHKPPNGIHANEELYNKEMKKMQDRFFNMGFKADKVRWLLGTKSRKLF